MKILDRIKLKNIFQPGYQKLGTFGGVFTPDVLTILGVIMYLRLGWVVGNAGFLGALVIIVLAKVITITTALSMSSITTNIKIGAGGAYSIITKSVGIEAGGSIGIPFYISQTLSAALYIVGFTEGWLKIFPDHSYFVVATAAWLSLIGIASISAAFAIRVQYLIMLIIALSILSFFLIPKEPLESISLTGNFEDGSFWYVFAIFFPAVTGIMAGANLSGDLKDPRKSIPLGTLTAIGVTMLIYISIAFVAAKFIPLDELRNNQMAIVDNAFSSPLVLLGILAATYSSALGSLLGAPRILQALSENRVVPFHNFFVQKRKNEPINAIIFTAIVIEAALILGNLNVLAALITMFFLITYGMINLVVFIQQNMKIISFRPTFKIPSFVSLIGAAGCMIIMFLINPVFSIVAFGIIISLYIWLGKRELKAESTGDIRGGMFIALAERASRIASRFPRHQISWKPDLLIPIDDPDKWAGSLLFIKNIVYPSGSIFAFTVKDSEISETNEKLSTLLNPLREDNLLVHSTVIEDKEFLHGTNLVIQTLKAGAMRPNTLFLTLGDKSSKDELISKLNAFARKYELGTLILRQHPRLAFGMQQNINLWLRDKSPNWHLSLLITLQLHTNWNGKLNLITAGKKSDDKKRLNDFLENLNEIARLPAATEYHVLIGELKEVMLKAPKADINIFGLGNTLPFEFIREAPELVKSSCMFVRDSGYENALV